MLDEHVAEQGTQLLRNIRGARLSSVQFVLNYLILGFDEKGALTTLVWPEVTRQGISLSFGMPGYRDGLCSLIAEVVDDVNVSSGEVIQIKFRDESRITIPLQSYSGAGERAIFTAPKNILFAW